MNLDELRFKNMLSDLRNIKFEGLSDEELVQLLEVVKRTELEVMVEIRYRKSKGEYENII